MDASIHMADNPPNNKEFRSNCRDYRLPGDLSRVLVVLIKAYDEAAESGSYILHNML